MPRTKSENKNENVDVKEEKIEVQTKKETPKKRVEIDRKELIPCRSVVEGVLTYKSPKTGLEVIWASYGTEEYLEFEELLTMKASKPVFLTHPWLVVDHDGAIEYLGLKQVYQKMVNVDELDEFFKLPLDEIKSKIKDLPKGIQETLGMKARLMIESGELYDIRIIKVLDEELKIELQDLILK